MTKVDGNTQKIKAELARTFRIASRLKLVDLLGHMSARIPGTDTIVFTPGHRSGVLPGLVQGEDIVLTDIGGRGEPDGHLPLGWHLDLAILRSRPGIGAILTASPETAMLRAIAGRAIRAVSHSQSHVVHQGIGALAPERMPLDRPNAAVIAAAFGDDMVLQIIGVATVVADSSILAALRRCHDLETLARLSDAADAYGGHIREVTPQESEAVTAQRPVEPVPSRPPNRYYDSLDHLPDRPPSHQRSPADDLKARVALSCRILTTRESLVAYFEHVSHRIPDTQDSFLMSPAKYFPDMTADDIGVVGTSGDCAWLEGPYPPAPFRWYHRDLFAARPDVNAIVHTHEVFGRAAVLAGKRLQPIHRAAALLAADPLPTLQTPSLGFLREHRDEAIRLLGDGSRVHLLSHGTDYLAPTLEEATVRAIQREELARISATVARFGASSPLSTGVLEDLALHGPSYDDWWRYYGSALA